MAAQFLPAMQQYRNVRVIARFQHGIGIDVDHLDPVRRITGIPQKTAQLMLHLMAKMAVGARNQRQPNYLVRHRSAQQEERITDMKAVQ